MISGPFFIGNLVGVGCRMMVLGPRLGTLVGTLQPMPDRYAGQRIFVVRREDYVYLVPFVEDDQTVFLKTIHSNIENGSTSVVAFGTRLPGPPHGCRGSSITTRSSASRQRRRTQPNKTDAH